MCTALGVCTALCMCIAFKFPGICQSFSKSLRTSLSPAFPFKLFHLAYCFPQLLSTASGSHRVKQMPLQVCFQSMLLGKAVFNTGWVPRQPCKWSLPRNYWPDQISNNDIFCEYGFQEHWSISGVNFSSEKTDSFYWLLLFRNQVWMLHMVIAKRLSLLPGPIRTGVGNTHIHTHISLYLLIYIY